MSNILLHYVEPHRFHPRTFNPRGCSFGSSYYARPWAIARDLWREAGSIVHRGFYGWSHADTWSLDAQLAHVLPLMLRHLADHAPGHPLGVYEAIGHPEHATGFGASEASTVHTVHGEEDSEAISEEADRYWRQWLRDHAQAFDDYRELMKEGWSGPLYPEGYWDSTFAAQVRELGLEAAFDAPGPLDALSDEEKQAAMQVWEAKVVRVKSLMHELVDHFEDLWD